MAGDVQGAMQDDELVKADLRNFERLKNIRAPWESVWREIDERFPNGAGGFQQLTPGARRGEQNFDTTAITANKRFAAAMCAITVPEEKQYIMIVGLPFTAEAVTLRPEPRARGETVQGARQKITKALLRLLDTFGVRIGDAAPGAPLDEVLDRAGDDQMDAGVPFFSGDQMTDVGGEWDRRGAVRFVSSDPLPCIVNAAVLHLEVEQ